VDPERMRKNLDLTRGLIASEAVMMGLGPALGRQRAHDLVYDVCRRAIASGGSFVGALAGEEAIASHIGRDELAKLADPANYLGLSGEMVDRVLAALPPSLQPPASSL
jgi:3-carboxy-cis,cis-muconate cycloisomerase